jgi:hypothetical protein
VCEPVVGGDVVGGDVASAAGELVGGELVCGGVVGGEVVAPPGSVEVAAPAAGSAPAVVALVATETWRSLLHPLARADTATTTATATDAHAAPPPCRPRRLMLPSSRADGVRGDTSRVRSRDHGFGHRSAPTLC